ncbi:MAG: phosphoribosylamine--glycine ligase [Pyrinomonadaceae bacterium]|nr:phosphoribosylamine--glycine ligase [Pyrinomonadaceae bacterium]
MKILVIGSGGREHAIIWAFNQSKAVTKIYCADGNAGISTIAECVKIKPTEIEKLADFAIENSIDLTFVGGETSLALGVVDEFEKRGLKIIGACKKSAELEASKAFAKDFMFRHKIPTAKYKVAHSTAEAKDFLSEFEESLVVKADGLAAGKGVVVCETKAEAISAIDELENLVGKEACSQIVLEERLIGKEISLILFADGKNFALMPPTRDHKRIGEGDTGANTGGMGTFTDDNLLTAEQTQKIIEETIKPTLQGCEKEGFPFKGILFVGLMMTADGAKVLEYNVRFGDPETQSILVRLETDLVEICQAILSQTLDKLTVKWKKGNSVCVILASENYPNKPNIGDVIIGLENVKDAIIFHAGTATNENGEFITSGGRVLGITAIGENLVEALNKSYNAVSQISWRGMQFRRDIGINNSQ